jgi:hypothetical protein
MPFTIGLKPFDPRDWIETDSDLETYLGEKDRLFESVPDKVFMTRPDTVDAQREVLDALARHLPERFPDLYRLDGDTMIIGEGDRRVRLDPDDPAPLKTASLLVQEDLVLMRASADGWRLVAASLCFPSSWSLAEKFDRPLQAIHIPVPAFGPGTRMAAVIARIFDKLKVETPVERLNWSLQEDGRLHHPRSKAERDEGAMKQAVDFLSARDAGDAWIRVERQTLRRMPVSGDILFTIRIHLDPLAVLKTHPAGAEASRGLAARLMELDADQLAYKGLSASRDQLVGWLRDIARTERSGVCAESPPGALD